MELNIPSTSDFKELAAKVDKILSIVTSEGVPPSQEWMTSAEVKRVLKRSDSTLKNYREKGLIDWKKVGGTYYYKLKNEKL